MSMVELNFLGQIVRLNAPVEQHEDLRSAAKLLDQRVLEMKERMQTVQVERALNIVALNLCFELLQAQQMNRSTEQILKTQIQQLSASLENLSDRHLNVQTAYEIQS